MSIDRREKKKKKIMLIADVVYFSKYELTWILLIPNDTLFDSLIVSHSLETKLFNINGV